MTSDHSLWGPSPPHLQLGASEVHVWRAKLDQPAETLAALFGILTPDEKTRAAEFAFQELRDHFVVARGVLRDILSVYLRVEPLQLRFSYNTNGKPALLRNGDSEDDLRFNLSHSHGLALYAVSQGRELGLDLEYMREDISCMQVAERFFSAREISTLRSLPPDEQTSGFYYCWTLKEAYLKATGEGLLLPLDQFAVSSASGDRASLLSTEGEASRWELRRLSVGSGYAAAIAVEGRGWKISRYEWKKNLRESKT